MERITKENNPEMWARLAKIERADKRKRSVVIGPQGVAYKVLRPNDGVLIFVAQTGVDGTYGQRSTKGLAG